MPIRSHTPTRVAPGPRRSLAAVALWACLAISAPAAAHPPMLESADTPAAADVRGGFSSPVYMLDPITPTGISVHVNMPVVRGTNNGWDDFARTVRTARHSGFALFLNNISGPRQGSSMIAATFDDWPYHDLIRLTRILAGSRVPVLLYVGPVENHGDDLVVDADRLLSWWNDALWISSLTGARCGLVIDGSTLYTPGGAPDGSTPFAWFSMFAAILAPYGMEVGFEAFRRHPNGTPYEDRRHYALLQYIYTRYATLPASADTDARIMSAIDALPAAQNALRNTVWLHNTPWDELGDGDDVPQEWLDAWGLTSPAQLQGAAVARLYAKGYALVLPAEIVAP